MKHIRASILSVILKNESSALVYLKIGVESCNLTLRFDRGPIAELCGYPSHWTLWTDDIDNVYSDGTKTTQIEKKDECRIMRQLRRALVDQFSDSDWDNDRCDVTRRSILDQMTKAIANLTQDETI